MRLHSPAFQKRLRRKVKAAITESAALKKEYRQARKYRRRYSLNWFGRGALSVGLGILVYNIAGLTNHPVTALAAIAIWMFGWIFFRAQSLWTLLHANRDIMALRLLPISDAAIFRWQIQKFGQKSIYSLFDLMAGLGGLVLFLDLPPSAWLAVPLIAAIGWVTLLALAALCVFFVPRKARQIIASGFIIGGFFSLYLSRFVARPILEFIDRFGPDLISFLPTGWPVSLFQLLPPNPRWSALVALLPIALTIWSLTYSIRRLRNGFRFEEQLLPVAPDIIPTSETEASGTMPPANQHQVHLGLTAIEELIQSRKFLEPVSWQNRGWFERWLWGWLDARERVLSEFAFPRGYAITIPWRNTFRNLVVAVAAAFAAGLASPTLKIWILGFGLLVTSAQALAQMLGSGNSFRSIFCSGVNIPIYAGFGIGYRELARLLIKCSIVQLPLFIPFVMVWSVLIEQLYDVPWQAGIVFGFKGSILLFAARFILITFRFSGSTNDSSRFRSRSFFLMFLVVSLVFAFLGLGGAGLFVPDAMAAWMMWALAVLDAYLLFRLYGRLYNANRFDLMSVPR